MREFIKEHSNDIVIISSFLLVAVVTGIFVTATGKAIVMEVDGFNSTRQDSDGSFEERHADGGRFKFYAE